MRNRLLLTAMAATTAVMGFAVAATAAPVPGSISGSVTDAVTGAPIADVNIIVFSVVGNGRADFTRTDAGGHYSTHATAGTYAVCFDEATQGSRHVGECYDDAVWPDGNEAPAKAERIVLAAGQDVTGIDAALTPGATITGRVTAAGGGGVAYPSVHLFDARGVDRGPAASNSAGYYTMIGLPPSNYRICVDNSSTDKQHHPGGLLARCAGDIAWRPNTPPPHAATVVPVAAGATAGADIVLPDGGGISGQVTRLPSRGENDRIDVRAYAKDGSYYAGISTGRSGAWFLGGLPAGRYTVCFQGAGSAGGAEAVSECHADLAWNGVDADLPSGRTAVRVRIGKAVRGVDATLEAAGIVDGTVSTQDRQYVQGAIVSAIDASGHVAAQLDFSGTFLAFAVPPSAAGYAFCLDPSQSDEPQLAPQCYPRLPWDGDPAHVPSGAEFVPVTVGAEADGIDFRLLIGT